MRDRRVKQLLLTNDGQAYRAALQGRFFAESPATADLAPSERRQLLTLLCKVTPGPVAAPDAMPGHVEAAIDRVRL